MSQQDKVSTSRLLLGSTGIYPSMVDSSISSRAVGDVVCWPPGVVFPRLVGLERVKCRLLTEGIGFPAKYSGFNLIGELCWGYIV